MQVKEIFQVTVKPRQAILAPAVECKVSDNASNTAPGVKLHKTVLSCGGKGPFNEVGMAVVRCLLLRASVHPFGCMLGWAGDCVSVCIMQKAALNLTLLRQDTLPSGH